jgi:diguanylate cyclase (GGDEF)-like protein
MLAVGKSCAETDALIRRSVLPLFLAGIVLTVLVALFTYLYTRKFMSSLLQIRGFLKEVSHGNLNAKLSSSVLDRRDELGEMAHSALTMQQSLRTLVDQDALTLLANRRSGDRRLRQLVNDRSAGRKPFCIALGDIDFFKKINDTYGHECGDVVLKNLASILRRHMYNRGFAARWGGEEFLLVYENTSLEDAYPLVEALLKEIRGTEILYGGRPVKMTMTFGMASCTSSDLSGLLRDADHNLYQGKADGRDRIVADL